MPGQQQSNSERIAGILSRARQQQRPDPFQGIAPRPAWEGAAGMPAPAAPPSPVPDQWAAGLRWGREQEGYPADSDNAPLDQAPLARLRGEVAEDEYSPLGPDWGWIDPLAGLAVAGGKAGVDALMTPFSEEARDRTRQRRQYLADAGMGALDFDLGNGGDQDWGAQSDFWADREGAQNVGDWLTGRPGHDRRMRVAQTLSDLDAQSQGVTVDPGFVVEGTDPSLMTRAGAFASDLWRGPSEAARESRRNAVTGFAMEDALREAGDEEGASAYERQARRSAAGDAAITSSGALELVPGLGLVDAALGAGRFGARQVLRATGGQAAEIPHYLTPRDWSPTEAFAGRADEPLHDPGLLTRQSESWRLPAAVTAVGAVAADQAMDGDFGDLNQLAGGAALTAGTLRLAPQVIRGGAEMVGRALGRDPLGDIAPRAEAGAARELEGGTRVYEDGYARTTVDPNGRVSHTYQGGYESGGGSAGEAVSSMRSALRALEQDIEETGRPSYNWTPGLADQQDPRLAQFYRDYFESRTPPGYVFSEDADGTMHLNRVVDAEASPVPSMPQRRFEAAIRDPETGRVYTGRDHDEVLDMMPDDVNARLAPIYNAEVEDPNVIGFVVDGQFMGREEGLQSLRAQRRPVRIGEQVNRDGSVTPASPIDWENGSTRLPADDEWFNNLAGTQAPPRRPGDDAATAAVVGGAGGALAGAALDDEASADDGTDSDGVPILPILGAGVGAASLAALSRGRLAQETRSQVGMFAGVNARTADHAALERAQQMAASGASRDAIWNETGWFQGVDGKWRFEIDDSGAPLRRTHAGNAYGQLDDALDHPELYDAYPSFPEIDYRIEGARTPSGHYRQARQEPRGWGGRDGMADLPPEILVRGANVGSQRSTTLHEVQHGVQDVEGFARGGMPENAWGLNEQARLNEVRAQKKEVLGGRDPYAIQNRIAAGYRVSDEDLAALEQWRELTRQEDEILANTLSPQEAYRRLAGETEARNVQARRNMTAEERRSRPPWETQDVPDDQQIIRFDGDRAESVGMSGGRGARRLGAETDLPSPSNPGRSENPTGTGEQRRYRSRNDERNARILALAEELDTYSNRGTGGAGMRRENSTDAIAARLRSEGYGEVSRSTVLGVLKRERDRLNGPTPAGAVDPDIAAAERLGMSVERYRSLSARRRNDPLDAIAPIAAVGGGAALAFSGEADAEDAEVLSDGRMIEPLPDVDLSQGQWQGEWSRTHLSDGSEALMRVIEGPDGKPYTIIGVQDRSGQIDFLGTVAPTEGPPGPYDPVGDVYEHAYDNVLSEPYEPAPREEEGRRQPEWVRPTLAVGAGLATRGLVSRGAGRMTQDFLTGAAAFGADTALGGDWTESVPLGTLLPLGARGAEWAVEQTAQRAGTTARDGTLLADPAFRAERDAFAETLSDEAPRVRTIRTENYHGDVLREAEGRAPISIPDSEAIDEGFARDLPSESVASPRQQFLDAYPEQQRQWMDEAARDGRQPDRGQIGFASGIDDAAPTSPRAIPATESAPASPDVLDDIAPLTPDEVGPMPRQYRATPEDIMENPDRGTLASPSRQAQSLATLAEEFGVEVARGPRGGVNGKRTAANIARAARTNPELQAELRRRGLWAAVLAGGGAGGLAATQEDPLAGVN